MMTYEELCNIEFLRKEAELALKSSNSKSSSEKCSFNKNQDRLLKKIQLDLINETYKFSDLRTKTVHEPKERKIDIPPFFPDRIYQRAMMDAVSDRFMDAFIDNTFSSIKGRGLKSCKYTIENIIHRSKNWYYINIDVKKFFENIDHDILKEKLYSLGIDSKILKMHYASIDKHKRGIAIGCFPSQYYANLYLADFDYMMLWMTGSRYVRYMDNCVIWVETKQDAHKLLRFIEGYFHRFLKLEINKNWQIAQIEKQPLRFCGYVFYSDHTLLRKNIREAAKKKARQLDRKRVSDEEWKRQMASYYGWFISCSGKNLWKSLKKNRNIVMKKEKTITYKSLKTLKEIKSAGEFGLMKEDRVSIEKLIGKEIILLEAKVSDKYRNGSRLVVKFQTVLEKEGEEVKAGEDLYFVTGSSVLRDQILRMCDRFPFICTILKLKNTRGNGNFFSIQ